MKKILILISSMLVTIGLFTLTLVGIGMSDNTEIGNNVNAIDLDGMELSDDILFEGQLGSDANSAKFVLYSDGRLVISNGFINDYLDSSLGTYFNQVKSIVVGPNDTGDQPVVFRKNMNMYFAYMNNVESIEFHNIDTGQTTTMSLMFSGLGKLTSLDLGNQFDTTNVTDMSNMFSRLRSLETLDLGENFHTQNVTQMSSMFISNESLTTLNLGDHFDTQNVVRMDSMFSYIESLEELNLGSQFNTSKVETMESMFHGSYALKTLDLGNQFNTINVANMSKMFMFLNNLETLNLGANFDTSNVTTMERMFYATPRIKKIDLGDKFDTSKVETMSSMFSDVSGMVELNLGNKFNTQMVNDMSFMFSKTESLKQLDLGDLFDTSNVTRMDAMFNQNNSLQTLNLGNKFNTQKVTNMGNMFYGMQSLVSLDLGDLFDTQSLTIMSNMFSGSSSLVTLDLKDKFDTSNVQWMENAFSDMDNLESITFGEFGNLRNVKSSNRMFYENPNLKTLDLSQWFMTENTNSTGFLEGTYLTRIILDENINISDAKLPNVIADTVYTGAWYQLENPSIRFKNSDEFMQLYDGSNHQFNGTYVLEKKTYSIRYDAGLGSGKVPAGVDSIEPGSSYTVDFTVTPTLEGSTFIGWKDLNTTILYIENINETFEVADQNIVLEAQYEAQVVGIDFYHLNSLVKRVETVYGSPIDQRLIPKIELEGHQEFKGWNKKVDGSGEWVDFNENIYQDEKVYAIYSSRKLEVTFISEEQVLRQVFVEYGDYLLDKDIPEVNRVGYQFIEWNTKEDGSGIAFNPSTDTVNEDLTLYAIEKVNEYQVKYYDKNGNFLFQDTVKYLDYFTIRDVPVKPGFTGYWLLGEKKYNGGEVVQMQDRDVTFRLNYTKDQIIEGDTNDNKPTLPGTGVGSLSLMVGTLLVILGCIAFEIKRQIKGAKH